MQLVINTKGTSLRRRGERFVLKTRERETAVQLSAAKVQSIVIATGVHLTSDVLRLAAEHNIDVVFLDRSGQPFSRVWQTRMGSTAQIRRRQLEIAETEEGFAIVRDWIHKKLTQQHEFLSELARRRPRRADEIEHTADSILGSAAKLEQLDGTIDARRETVMGIEGSAGRVYFATLGKLMPSEYGFTGRSRRPAEDGFNAMLNYAYGVLYSQVERACILAGLDPHLGLLHTDSYNKPSLVFDLIEPFRILAERTSVLFFTGRRARQEFFREVPGGMELAPDGRAALVAKLNERLERTVRYPVQRTKPRGARKYRRIKNRAVIQHEAHALANRLLGKTDMPRIIESEQIFADQEMEQQQ